jgi:hypothetical protein
MRGVALATLGVVLAALVVWWLAADERGGEPRTLAAPETERRAPEPAPELTVAAAPREEAREPSVPAQASLGLAEVSAPARVPLAGTLVVPREWELGNFELSFSLLDTPLAGFEGRFSIGRDAMQSIDEPASVFTWSAGDVQPGRYKASLDEPGFSVGLVVGPEGPPRTALVEVPPPAEVRVRCVEANTGLPAA